MKGYKIYNQCEMGFEENIKYTVNYDKAVQMFNNSVRSELRNIKRYIITKEEWGEHVQYFKESIEKYHEDKVILSRTYPFIMFTTKDRTKVTACIPYVYRSSYEYEEYDITESKTVLEVVELEE